MEEEFVKLVMEDCKGITARRRLLGGILLVANWMTNPALLKN